MTARNYDIILTVPSTTGFISGNIIVGSTSATSGFIANVDSTAKQLKVKLNNVLQEFHTSETITSSSSIIGGSRINTTVLTPITSINNIGAAAGARTEGTYSISASDYTKTGLGTGATFTIVVNGSGAAAVTIDEGGDRFVIGDVITVADSKLGSGGAAALTFNVATTGGTSGSSKRVTDITRANPGVVTANLHGFTDGVRIAFSGINGMTEVNGQIYEATLINENSFSIVNTSAFTAYSGDTGFATFITTLDVANTRSIQPGYQINSVGSNGYTSPQTVDSVLNTTQLTVSAPPNTMPNGNLLFVDISSNLTSVPFTSNIFLSSETTASTTISSQVPSPFIAEKNAFTQNPIVRLYDVYYPGEWFPPDQHGNPTGEGTGRSWPTNFPLKFADIAGDLVSDLKYNVTYDGESYIPFPIDITSTLEDWKLNDQLIISHLYTLTRARANGFGYSEDIVGLYGKSNASWNYEQTIASPATDGTKGVWEIQKNDSRDIQGGVVRIKTTFANFLDVWPEHSSIKYITSNVVEVYNAMPYRVGDTVKSSKGSSSATIQSIQENRFLFLSDVLEANTSIGDDVFIVNADVDTESYVEDVFKIDHLEELGNDTASFGLVTWLQYFKQITPRRKYYKNTCQWQYKGEECQYPGPGGGTIPGTSLTANTNPIAADNTTAAGPEGDICGKNILACTLRNNGIHFGGFPATGRTIPKQ